MFVLLRSSSTLMDAYTDTTPAYIIHVSCPMDATTSRAMLMPSASSVSSLVRSGPTRQDLGTALCQIAKPASTTVATFTTRLVRPISDPRRDMMRDRVTNGSLHSDGCMYVHDSMVRPLSVYPAARLSSTRMMKKASDWPIVAKR